MILKRLFPLEQTCFIKVIYLSYSLCLVSSAFPPTCQKECWCSPGRLCKLQEIQRKLWQQVKCASLLLCIICFCLYLYFHNYNLFPPPTSQGVCCERGGCWYPGIFQCYAGNTTSVQIWEAAVRRHPGQPPGYINVSNLRRPSPTQTLW